MSANVENSTKVVVCANCHDTQVVAAPAAVLRKWVTEKLGLGS
jgi:hypothetical protein